MFVTDNVRFCNQALEECKYKINRNKVEKLISYDLDSTSCDSEFDNGSDNDESNSQFT